MDQNLTIDDESTEENFDKSHLFFDVHFEKLYNYFISQNIQVNFLNIVYYLYEI